MCSFFRPIWYSLGCFFGRDSREMFSPLYLDNFISATRITPQVRKRARHARGPGGSELPASEKRAVGSLGRLHHAAQSVWTHNVWPARKTGCRGWGCKQSRPPPRAVRAAKLCPRCSPSPGRELQIRRKKTIATILATIKGENPNFKFS